MISIEKRSTNPCHFTLKWQYQHKCQHWGVSTRPGGRGCSWCAVWHGGTELVGFVFIQRPLCCPLTTVRLHTRGVCLDIYSICTAAFVHVLICVELHCRVPPNFSVTFQDRSFVSSLYVSSGVIKDIRVYLKWRGCVMLFGIIFHYTPYEKCSVCLQRSSWAIQNSLHILLEGLPTKPTFSPI